MSGWIKLHRAITDNPLWDAEPFTKAQAWIDLLIHANFSDNQIYIKGQLINVKKGQQARSELTLAKEWKWSRGKVKRFLSQLKNNGMIEIKTSHLTSIISICNYSIYQEGGTTDGTSVGTADGTTDGQLTVHSKECKERKEVKNVPYQLIAELFNEVCFNLPKVKSPERMTDKRKNQVKKFWDFHKDNQNSDFYADYFAKANSSPFLIGSNERGWKADFDFLMKPETHEKLMDGKYGQF